MSLLCVTLCLRMESMLTFGRLTTGRQKDTHTHYLQRRHHPRLVPTLSWEVWLPGHWLSPNRHWVEPQFEKVSCGFTKLVLPDSRESRDCPLSASGSPLFQINRLFTWDSVLHFCLGLSGREAPLRLTLVFQSKGNPDMDKMAFGYPSVYISSEVRDAMGLAHQSLV